MDSDNQVKQLKDEIKKLKQKVQELEEKHIEEEKKYFVLKNIFELNPYAITLYDANGYYLDSNDSFNKIYNYQTPPPEYCLFEDPIIERAGYKEAVAKVKYGEIVMVPEICYNPSYMNPNWPDVTWWFKSVFFPLVDKNGKLEKIVLIFEVITEQKQAQKEKDDVLKELFQSQKMELVGQLAGGIAHDFNNILLSVLSNIDLIEILDKELVLRNLNVKKGFFNIKKTVNRAAKLIRRLLTFSKKNIPKLERINVNNSIKELYSMLIRLINEDIELKLSLCEDPIFIDVDPAQFEQILINLIVNARDAIAELNNTSRDFFIKIKTSFIKIESQESIVSPGDYLLISVKDNGVGMDSELINKIFTPFFTTKASDKGTGLGLATVDKIIKMNKAFLNVESEVNKGTDFVLYWPISKLKEESILTEKSEEIFIKKGNETILYVEDDKNVAKVIALSLKALGYKILIAYDGQEALDIAKTNLEKIDLLFTDIVIPKIPGKKLVEIVRKLKPSIKVLYGSGYFGSDFVPEDILNNKVNFIQKPYLLKELSFKIRESLDN